MRPKRWGLAAAQAAVSHDHPDAIAAAQALALAILLARSGCHARPFDISAAGTVPPAITAVLEAEVWEDAVRAAVCLGGDTDTLACIAGAVAEVIHGARICSITSTALIFLTLSRMGLRCQAKSSRVQTVRNPPRTHAHTAASNRSRTTRKSSVI